jgi:hypothetical protein
MTARIVARPDTFRSISRKVERRPAEGKGVQAPAGDPMPCAAAPYKSPEQPSLSRRGLEMS